MCGKFVIIDFCLKLHQTYDIMRTTFPYPKTAARIGGAWSLTGTGFGGDVYAQRNEAIKNQPKSILHTIQSGSVQSNSGKRCCYVADSTRC